jgi:hypothetical protein
MYRWQIGIYEKAMPGALSWKEKLLTAKSFGYDFLEISIDETDEKLARLKMPQSERLALIALMFETGIPIRTMCLSGHRKYPLGSEDSAVWRLWKMPSISPAILVSASSSLPATMSITMPLTRGRNSSLPTASRNLWK